MSTPSGYTRNSVTAAELIRRHGRVAGLSSIPNAPARAQLLENKGWHKSANMKSSARQGWRRNVYYVSSNKQQAVTHATAISKTIQMWRHSATVLMYSHPTRAIWLANIIIDGMPGHPLRAINRRLDFMFRFQLSPGPRFSPFITVVAACPSS